MGAASKDRPILDRPGDIQDVPVAATTKIYAGTLVMDNGAGYAVPAAETSGRSVLGIAQDQADNSAGGAGDIKVRLKRNVACWFENTGLTIADRGDAVMCDDDQTVKAFAGGSANVRAGILLDVSATQGALVYVDGQAFSVITGPNLTLAGDLAVGGNAAVTGNTTMTGTLQVTGLATLAALEVDYAATDTDGVPTQVEMIAAFGAAANGKIGVYRDTHAVTGVHYLCIASAAGGWWACAGVVGG